MQDGRGVRRQLTGVPAQAAAAAARPGSTRAGMCPCRLQMQRGGAEEPCCGEACTQTRCAACPGTTCKALPAILTPRSLPRLYMHRAACAGRPRGPMPSRRRGARSAQWPPAGPRAPNASRWRCARRAKRSPDTNCWCEGSTASANTISPWPSAMERSGRNVRACAGQDAETGVRARDWGVAGIAQQVKGGSRLAYVGCTALQESCWHHHVLSTPCAVVGWQLPGSGMPNEAWESEGQRLTAPAAGAAPGTQPMVPLMYSTS